MGKTTFWKGHEEYICREIGNNTYEISKWGRGDTPDAIYTVKGTPPSFCSCPARKKNCVHMQEISKWLKVGKPSMFGKNVKADVLKKINRMIK